MFLKQGKMYLSENRKGVVMFSEYPLSKKDFLEKKLSNAANSATFVHDPVRNVLYHYFIVPLASLRDQSGIGGFTPEFVKFVETSKIYGRFIPAVQFSLVEGKVATLKFSVLVDDLYFK
jgi:hypothetical protein